MHDNKIMIEMVSNRIFKRHFLINSQFQFSKIDVIALQSIMHFLRNREKIWTSLNDAPTSSYPGTVHQKGQG